MSADDLAKRRRTYYILKGRDIVEADLMTWGAFFEKPDRIVGRDRIGTFEVSTIFLGLDHRFKVDGPPILFETMIFDGNGDDQYCERCATYDQAEAMHQSACAYVRSKLLS